MGEPWDSAPFDEDRDWEFNSAPDENLPDLIDLYANACELSRGIVASASSLDQLSERSIRRGGKVTLRWILLHMIEETARHAGHADLLRETIDGETGI